jgi:hypothetical protein
MSRSSAAGRHATRLHRRQDSIQDEKTAQFIRVSTSKFEYQINEIIIVNLGFAFYRSCAYHNTKRISSLGCIFLAYLGRVYVLHGPEKQDCFKGLHEKNKQKDVFPNL